MLREFILFRCNGLIIEIKEDTKKAFYTGRGKNRRRMKSSVIAPSMPYIKEVTTKLMSERLNEMFN